jgi:hypothetical protein
MVPRYWVGLTPWRLWTRPYIVDVVALCLSVFPELLARFYLLIDKVKLLIKFDTNKLGGKRCMLGLLYVGGRL